MNQLFPLLFYCFHFLYTEKMELEKERIYALQLLLS